MNLEAYWQENRTFVLRVAGGFVLFLVALLIIDSTVGGDVAAQRRLVTSAQSKLNQPSFTSADEQRAREDNRALLDLLAELEQRVDFAPREGFRPKSAAVTAGRYLDAVANVRMSLLPLARRRGMVLDPTLGLPEQSPTREEELARYLDGLDLVDRLVRVAVELGVERIEKVRIRLDPGLFGREGLGYVERTRVEFSASGRSAPLLALMQRLARLPGQPLFVDSAALEASRQRADEARLELVLLAPRVARSAETKETRP